MKDISLLLSAEEVNAVLQTLGQLPTHSGAYPLMLKIKEQADAQVKGEPNDHPV